MEEETPTGVPSPANAPTYRRPRHGWERAAPSRQTLRSRDTIRIDGPSPSQEVLAGHDAELGEQQPDDGPEAAIITF